MTTLQISLSDTLKQFIEHQAARSGYRNASAYVEALIAEAQRADTDVALEAELENGLDSGPAIEADDSFWAQFRARYRARLGKGIA